MKDTVRYTLVLFIISFLAAILLSTTYAVTQPRIEKARQEQEDEAVKEVLPQAKQTKEAEKNGINYYEALDEGGTLIGYIFICEAKGYSSVIRAVVSAKPDGTLLTIKILEQNETPGIGSKITEGVFLDGFKGKNKNDTIDTITGATISSSALVSSVKATMEKIF